MPDFLCDELFTFEVLPLAFVAVRVQVAFGDEAVAFHESFVGPFGGGAVHDEVVKTCFEFRERAVVFVSVVFLPEACVEGVC